MNKLPTRLRLISVLHQEQTRLIDKLQHAQTVTRTISDNANEDSAGYLTQFIERVAARYAFHIVKCLQQ
jgi:hypothetical protein